MVDSAAEAVAAAISSRMADDRTFIFFCRGVMLFTTYEVRNKVDKATKPRWND